MREWRPLLLFGVLLILGMGLFRAYPSYPVMETEPVEWTVEEREDVRLALSETPRFAIQRGYTLRYCLENRGETSWHYDGPIHFQQEIEGEWYELDSTLPRGRRPNPLDLTLAPGGEPYEDILFQRMEGYGNRLGDGHYRLVAELRDDAGTLRRVAAEFTV